MAIERTQTQGGDEYRQSQQLSLERTRPPTDVPGYDPEHFLGAGAFGEVWVAIDRNTGRKVAIKFYAHRGGLDWSLLSREVEKLVFLSADRYVVQLLDVGWDSDPPYYVMEYIEHGSLDDLLKRQGTLPIGQAVSLFREVAIGLVHAHGRGVLHCDLKPANILLDQDNKPRLGDFGQSRLSHEQDPALGTLFFMAPEQADLKAVPDARWDVYALGALLYTMLTGAPPYRTEEALRSMEDADDLEDRLARYRQLIVTSPRPSAHRQVPDVDSKLAEILERCLEVDPERRFPNPQTVIDALDEYEKRKTERRLQLLGLFGPIVLVIAVGLFGLTGLDTAVEKSEKALVQRALDSNRLAARAQADAVGGKLERRFDEVERLAADAELQESVREVLQNAELSKLAAQLNDPEIAARPEEVDDAVKALRQEYRAHPARQPLQQRFEEMFERLAKLEIASCFFNGPDGLQIVRAPPSLTIGRNYAWRTYFHGGVEDRPDWRPGPDEHIQQTQLSSVFRSQASQRWIACVSTPVYWSDDPDGEFLGVLGITFEIGRFVDLVKVENGSGGQRPVLVDWRDRPTKGLILQHPLFDEPDWEMPPSFKPYRIRSENLPSGSDTRASNYTDPLGAHPQGEAFRGRWLAEMAPVIVRGENSGLLVIVQETYNHAIGPTLDDLRRSLIWIGVGALAVMIVVPALLWHFVVRGIRQRHADRRLSPPPQPPVTAAQTMATIVDRKGD